MFRYVLTVQCPTCKHKMQYQYDGRDIAKKRKACVYCGKNFGVQRNRMTFM